jgi:hypothetical protein
MALGGGGFCVTEIQAESLTVGAVGIRDGTGNPVPTPNKNEGVKQKMSLTLRTEASLRGERRSVGAPNERTIVENGAEEQCGSNVALPRMASLPIRR